MITRISGRHAPSNIGSHKHQEHVTNLRRKLEIIELTTTSQNQMLQSYLHRIGCLKKCNKAVKSCELSFLGS
jgi:hypothetical protein